MNSESLKNTAELKLQTGLEAVQPAVAWNIKEWKSHPPKASFSSFITSDFKARINTVVYARALPRAPDRQWSRSPYRRYATWYFHGKLYHRSSYRSFSHTMQAVRITNFTLHFLLIPSYQTFDPSICGVQTHQERDISHTLPSTTVLCCTTYLITLHMKITHVARHRCLHPPQKNFCFSSVLSQRRSYGWPEGLGSEWR